MQPPIHEVGSSYPDGAAPANASRQRWVTEREIKGICRSSPALSQRPTLAQPCDTFGCYIGFGCTVTDAPGKLSTELSMGSEQTFDPASFKSLEYAGWQKAAASYGDLFGSLTRHATEALLDATSVGAGSDVLEVCCGVGYGAGAAQSRGARAVGVDFAPATVEAAKEYHPAALFMQGDAEALDFDTGSFDAVICAFGINHLQHPEKAISEAFRVLRPGSRYAFTMWCVPGKSKFHQLVLDAIRTHGTLDVPLPDAPPPFHFSQPETCIAALLGASFINPGVIKVPLAYRPNAPEQVLKLTYSAVRLEMILSFQTAEAKERIHREILAGVDGFRSGGTIEIPMPAVLASATKPS